MSKSRNATTSRITLDAEHTKYVNFFNNKEKSLEADINKLAKYIQEYDFLCTKIDSKCTGDEICRKYTLEQDIDLLRINIDATKDGHDQAEYYMKVSNILMQ